MKTINKRLLIEFDTNHNKILNVGGLDLIRPDMWFLKDKEDGSAVYESNTNKLETHPQVATVIADASFVVADGFDVDGNEKYKHIQYSIGDLVFLHYMAKEWEEILHFKGGDVSCVDADHVLFLIRGNEFIMSDGVFLGDYNYNDAPKTESGIFLTSSDEKIKDHLSITISHLPDNCGHDYKHINIGDTVLPIDKNNYVLNYGDKSYVMLKEHDIMGVLA